MRILVTCKRYPRLPFDGETLRIYHYAKHLSNRHELDLVCLGENTAHNPEIDTLFKHIRCFPLPPINCPNNLLSRLASGLDPRTLYPRSPEMKAYLEEIASDGQYDLVWDAGCYMQSQLVEVRRSVPLLADQIDDSFLALLRSLRVADSLFKKLWYVKQIGLQWLYQFWHLRNAEAILFVSEKDAATFRRFLPFTKTHVIENGVDENYFRSEALPNTGMADAAAEIVFEGSMFFAPNVDAARYFVEEIFPLIRQAIPDVQFTIVGRDPTAEVRALTGDGVIVTGSVPDVRPYLQRASVFVCPMRSGAGIKNKILQAWSMGKAMVSTTAGVGSIRTEEGRNILIRDTPEKFADAVVDLLQNPEQGTRLGEAGRATIVAHYTWAAKTTELEALMQRIVDQRCGLDGRTA
jgi:glycosyltransferase involved in cell wall biosynthesis